MPNTYAQIFIHVVFAVKYRHAVIPLEKQNEIYSYICGIINRFPNCNTIKIGGPSDHVHILIKLPPNIDVSKLVKSIKIGSTNFINNHHLIPFKFAWQEGFGAFSVSATHTDVVANYIEHQIEHHANISFIEEYKRILERNKIEYDENYIFKELE